MPAMSDGTRRFPGFDYDVFLVGGGQTNVPLGPKLAQDGFKTALAEREHMGGSCVNFGCLPSKAVHASARVAHLAQHGRDFGIEINPVDVRPSLPDVLARARVFVNAAERAITSQFADNDVTLYPGHARLVGREGDGFALSVTTSEGKIIPVTARYVVLDPGSRTHRPDVEGIDQLQCLTSERWINCDEVPARMVILGGGYIGVEMSQFYRRMGRDVTVVQRASQVLTREDREVADWLQQCLAGEGIGFRMNATPTRLENRGDAWRLHLEAGEPIDCDTVFLATGRRPNTSDLGLDTVGVVPDAKGVIETDPYGETVQPGLFATGDCRGGPAFTHTAHDDHHILLGRLLGQRDPGGSDNRKQRIVPYAVFTDPELGRVGLSEGQAVEQNVPHTTITVKMRSNDRARAVGEPEGLVKLVLDPHDPRGRLLGATMLGNSAGELIHAFVMLMHLDQPLESILDAIFIHPTLFEIVHQAVDTWHKSKP